MKSINGWKKMPRCVVIGTTNSAISLAKGVLDGGGELVAVVSLKKELLPNNSVDIESFAKSVGCEYYEVDDINNFTSLFASFDMDYLIVSWPKILKENIYKLSKRATIVAHATDLPKNRGRHAGHWYKVLGLTDGVLSFFYMDSGVDSGEIILKLPFKILKSDTINDINKKIDKLSKDGICEILQNESLVRNKTKQVGIPNYWRKRNMHDVLIDVRMPIRYIISLVDSFCPPYPCAKLICESKVFDITKAEKIDKECNNIEYGKVFLLDDTSIILKCGDGAIKLYSNESFKDYFVKLQGLENKKGLINVENLDSAGGGGIYVLTPSFYIAKHKLEL
ncbi:formyltransferase family protein [Helicobacter sp. A82]|uniref:Formyltransferase family protein n=2 Tax=Helicobacter ibis TaxID=2962633 RepID=A0ABT4VGG5_9HELI|nr:formyltransferase family protein [Helicobacter ibis]